MLNCSVQKYQSHPPAPLKLTKTCNNLYAYKVQKQEVVNLRKVMCQTISWRVTVTSWSLDVTLRLPGKQQRLSF